ncbi:hypothetical protein OAE24_07990 [Candidatus Thioglobus sp.]|nr:hypothetical protein [Candidatus Thioglobus sp.]
MTDNSNAWAGIGTYGSEQSAIISAKSTLKRSNVKTVRVKDANGNVVYMDSK